MVFMLVIWNFVKKNFIGRDEQFVHQRRVMRLHLNQEQLQYSAKSTVCIFCAECRYGLQCN